MGASDYMVGNAPAGASYAAPLVGFQLGQALADLPDAYMKGREQKQLRQAQDAFPNGLDDPRYKNPDGSPNVNAIINTGAKIGGLPFVMKMFPFLSPPPSGGAEPTIGSEPSQAPSQPPVSRGAIPNAAGPGNLGAQGAPPQPKLSSAGADNEGEQTINSLASEVFGERDVTNMLPRYAAAVGNKLGETLTPEQARAARALMQRSKGAMASTSPEDITPPGQPSSAAEQASNGPGGRNAAPFAAGGASGSPAPPAGPARVAQAQPNTAGLPPNWTEAKAAEYETSARNHMKVADYYARLGNKEAAANQREQAKSQLDTAKMIREKMATNAELTGTEKELRNAPEIAAAAARKKLGELQADAVGKRVGEVVEAGGPGARETINTLNEMEDAFKRGGTNISTGPGAEAWLKVKQAVNNMQPGFFKGVAESEEVQKLNAFLAASAAKSMTARPSQLEFRAFMANNPGLLTSREGSLILINLLRQGKEQSISLSRLAMNPKNLFNWTDVEDKFYNDTRNKIKSPYSGEPLRGDEHVKGMGEPVPAVGSVVAGHRYLGGDPHKSESWAPVAQPAAANSADRT